jgi:hypothetical protein
MKKATVGLGMLMLLLGVCGMPAAALSKETPAVVSGYGKFPLSFEANGGQTDPPVKFLSRGRGDGFYLTPTEPVLTLRRSAPADSALPPLPRGGEGRGEGSQGASDTVRMKLVGANPHPKMAGEETLPGKVNYLVGNNPEKWRTNLPTFGKVRYTAVYPGIDLVYYGNQQQMEYDFVVAPGADPKQIRMEVQGLFPSPQPSAGGVPPPAGGEGERQDVRVSIADNGDLVVPTDGGEVRMKKPIVYQEIAGKRVSVEGGYRLFDAPSSQPSPASGRGRKKGESRGEGTHVSFQVATYGHTRPLVIDPILVYSSYLGGSVGDSSRGIAVDATGAVYVTGTTGSIDFPMASSPQSARSLHGTAFVTKINPAGSAIVYSTYLGGGSSDLGLGIAVDATGAAYVTGSTFSSDFPTVSPFQPDQPDYDAFVTKIDPAGSALVYFTYLGGESNDEGRAIAVDATGAAYVVSGEKRIGFLGFVFRGAGVFWR